MLKRIIKATLVMLAIIMVSLPAYASLVPMSWGFPSLVQNNSLTSFQSDLSNATDLQTSNIAFPTTSTGTLDTTFPTISQVSQTGNMLSELDYTDQNEYSQFAYPWLSIGDSPVPSMGLG
jgi:predicted PurR-regulated permease PerM